MYITTTKLVEGLKPGSVQNEGGDFNPIPFCPTYPAGLILIPKYKLKTLFASLWYRSVFLRADMSLLVHNDSLALHSCLLLLNLRPW